MIWQPTDDHILQAAEILSNGGIGAIPTETVYGLAGNALNPNAVARIFEAKNRPTFNPLIVHIRSFSQLHELTVFQVEKIQPLLDHFWPGALTVVLPKSEIVPDLVTGGRDSVAVRMPNHPVTKKLLDVSGLFLAAPSANPFNYISPTSARHVESQLGSKIDFILDGGSSSIGIESTVISFVDDQPELLRHGGIPFEAIRQFLPRITERLHNEENPDSPGQLKHHYSPKTPLKIWNGETLHGSKTGFLSWNFIPENSEVNVLCLTTTESHIEAAARLFDCLHRFDRMNLDIIYVQPVPETGLGRAVMDRIRRASTK